MDDRRRSWWWRCRSAKRFTLAGVVLFAFLDFGASAGQPLDPANRNLAKWLASTKAPASAKA